MHGFLDRLLSALFPLKCYSKKLNGYRLEMSKKKECSGAAGSSSEPKIRNAFWRKVWSQEEVIFSRALYLAEEYGNLVKGEPKINAEKLTKWSPPPTGKYKLNVDDAYILEMGVGGIGVVVRNDKGEVMAAMALPLVTSTSPKHAEIMALQFGVEFAQDVGFSSILVESDSQTVVNYLKNDEEESWASYAVFSKACLIAPRCARQSEVNGNRLKCSSI